MSLHNSIDMDANSDVILFSMRTELGYQVRIFFSVFILNFLYAFRISFQFFPMTVLSPFFRFSMCWFPNHFKHIENCNIKTNILRSTLETMESVSQKMHYIARHKRWIKPKKAMKEFVIQQVRIFIKIER